MTPIWQRVAAIFIYLLPWSDSIPFGRNLFLEFSFLQWLAIPALPIVLIEQAIPFGSLILFFVLFLTVVRNPNVPYFVRFNTLQAILLDIGVVIISYAFQIILQPFAGGIIVRTLSSTVFLGILAMVVFSISECIQGKEPDIPWISEAVKIQI